MVKGKEVTGVESGSVQQEPERMLRPPVDISEDAEGITLVADMPGLDDDSLDVTIDQGVLTIQGNAPAGSGDYHDREFAMAGYWRQFLLSDIFDAEKAEATIRQGVMTLKIPKAERAKPKRIAVSVH